MRTWTLALKSLTRRRGPAALGILGIAAVGALLFDMLLLSRGLVVSLRNLLDSAGFDIRVVATENMSMAGPRLPNAVVAATAIAALAEVDEVVPLRFGAARIDGAEKTPLQARLTGADVGRRALWTVLEGNDLGAAPGGPTPPLMVSRSLARALHLGPGDAITLRGSCSSEPMAPPPRRFRVAGIAAFPFDDASALTAVMTFADFRRTCGFDKRDDADLLLVASREGHGAAAAVRAIRRLRPDLHVFSNEELVARFQQVGFSYFRQISIVLSTVTLFFGFLLITVLLTVSVNQRFAEIAALRALGFSRRRVVMDVLCQSALLVGAGGLLSLPLGFALSRWLDAILRSMPDFPAALHFFAFHPRALLLHGALLVLTAALAALYPMWIVARLPIAATLRNEVVT